MSKTVQEKDTLKNLSNASNVEMPVFTSLPAVYITTNMQRVPEVNYSTGQLLGYHFSRGDEKYSKNYKTTIVELPDRYFYQKLSKNEKYYTVQVPKQGYSVDDKGNKYQVFEGPKTEHDGKHGKHVTTIMIEKISATETDSLGNPKSYFEKLAIIVYDEHTDKAKAKKETKGIEKAEVKEEAKAVETSTDAKALKAYKKGSKVHNAVLGDGVITKTKTVDGKKHAMIKFGDVEKHIIIDTKLIQLVK